MTADLDRRRFLQLALGAAGVAALGGSTALVASAAPKGGGGGGGGGGGTATGNPLFLPQVIAATGGTLTAAATTEALGTSRSSRVLTYNSSFPAPTFVVRKGGAVDVALSNQLPGETSVHWHGLVVPTAMDGQPHEAVPSGGSRPYTFTVRQRAALNFYHPHPHLQTGTQVYMGMAGAFVVRDDDEDALDLPWGDHEVPLAVRDASFDSAGNLTYGGKASGFEGKLPLTNGTLDAYLDVDAGTYRLRVVNAATARIFRLALSTGAPMTLIGNDGGLLPAAKAVASVDVSPGERVDLLVDVPVGGVKLRCLRAGWTLLDLKRTKVGGTRYVLQAPLPAITPLGSSAMPVTRTFSFDGMTRINGKVFDHMRIDFRVPSNTVERWRFTTSGNAPHPVHVHGASFQVVQRVGGRARTNGMPDGLYPWERGWKDTVLLEDGEQVDVLIRFDWDLVKDSTNRPQRYLIHCHKLEHEDAGMMAAFEVDPPVA